MSINILRQKYYIPNLLWRHFENETAYVHSRWKLFDTPFHHVKILVLHSLQIIYDSNFHKYYQNFSSYENTLHNRRKLPGFSKPVQFQEKVNIKITFLTMVDSKILKEIVNNFLKNTIRLWGIQLHHYELITKKLKKKKIITCHLMALESYMEEEFKKHAAHTINDGT